MEVIGKHIYLYLVSKETFCFSYLSCMFLLVNLFLLHSQSTNQPLGIDDGLFEIIMWYQD